MILFILLLIILLHFFTLEFTTENEEFSRCVG